MFRRSKIFWYLINLRNLLVVCVRTLFYCLVHPQKIATFLFALYSVLNEFYQSSHGHLYNFEATKLFQEMKSHMAFVRCNIFNMESIVTRPNETQTLCALVSHLKPKKIFEIGTYNGFTTLHFAYNAPEDSRIYTLDLPADFSLSDQECYSYDDILVMELSKKNIERRFFKKDSQGKKITELFGDSKLFDFSPYQGQMDLIFIDGNHSYPYVASDTENAFKMLSPDGVIVWHDFDYIVHRDVFKYLNHLVKEHKIYSIPNTRFAIYGKQLC